RARNHVLPRNAHASAGLVVAQPVVMALQGVADELTHRERQMAVRAAVLERDRRAVLQPVEHDRLPENGAAERLSPDLAIVGGELPIILEEHGAFLRAWRCVFPCGGW